MKRWYTITALFASLILFSEPASGQNSVHSDDDFDSSVSEAADDVSTFIDSVVEGVEFEVDRMIESRNNERRLDREWFDEEQDGERSKIDAVTFNGNTEIVDGDTVQTDLVVKNGDLQIAGVILGDVLVVNGNITLKGTSKVMGNVRAMNGSITKETGSFVEGFTEQSANTSSQRRYRKGSYRTKYTNSFKPYYLSESQILDDNVLFRYNRVEGFFIGFGAEKKFYWDGSKAVSGSGSFGYGFASHKWRLQLALDRQFAASEGELYEIGGEVHSLTDSKDEWLMNLAENTLSSIFFREDFRDYFQREGYSLHTARYTKDADVTSMIDVRYLYDRYSSMFSTAEWGVFGKNTFRSNPLVNNGIMRSLSVSGGVSTVEKYRYHIVGWNLFVRGEYGGRVLGGDFDFTQAMIDLRRFQPISDDDQINVRVRVGALEGAPLMQKTFELGGANTMPAFGFKEFSGNRMVLANVEYRVSGDIIDEIFFWPNSLSLIAFGDAGAVSSVNTSWAVYEGFNSIKTSQVKSDYGFAIGWHDGDARLGFAWRTDKQSPVSIFFRLHRAF